MLSVTNINYQIYMYKLRQCLLMKYINYSPLFEGEYAYLAIIFSRTFIFI